MIRINHLSRIIVISFTLARYRVFSSINFIKIPFWIKFLSYLVPPAVSKNLNNGIKIARAFESLGPIFIKLGQVLSTRPDLIGFDTANDLQNLQDKLRPFPADKAIEIIEAEFEKKLSDIFIEFGQQPIAAASIAQVHKAKTLLGDLVAVKILRPNIEYQFKRDISLFRYIIKILLIKNKSLERLRLNDVLDELEKTVHQELDLRLEAAAASELQLNLSQDADIIVPKAYWNLTTKSILTLEWIDGFSISNKEKMVENQINPTDIAAKIAICFFNQAYRDGFFHADMHPGNILITNNGKVALIDFGIMGRLSEDDKFFIAAILKGFLDRDYEFVAKLHFMAGYTPDTNKIGDFALACRSIGEPIIGQPLNKISVGKLLAQLFQITDRFNMQTQPQLLLLQKTLILVEGVGSKLDEGINMWELARPWISDWSEKNLGVKQRAKFKAREILSEFDKFLDYYKKPYYDIAKEIRESRLNQITQQEIFSKEFRAIFWLNLLIISYLLIQTI